ncbi:hypothetical protein SMACR_02072 [Sordaria macrospora]|uniref:Glutathione S-transferase n=1 Tax=Sordaria macrospora TaxID=5147 RepID=A0A8S8ZVH0_SORMA|nr:hypothetical protein SMACR_02072 [Sordaria macrospora]KAH7629235.1 hypothetical protein B0T09DRAFT_321966 [Sordaria sp. MPI-SDFR-AT-0083]WPJ63849.1 hypothetical protein SMAC4_02072 [Sordaria macrospora]
MATTTDHPKITLYWLNDSRAQRMVWLLEELGVPYDVKIFHRGKDMLAPAELQQIHPLGKSPVVTIQPTEPGAKEIVLAESPFIAQYLCDHFGKDLIPKKYNDGQEGKLGGETEEWMRYQHLLYYSEGSLMPPLLVALILSVISGPKIPFFIRPITSTVAGKVHNSFVVPNIEKHCAFLQQQLETSPKGGNYLCGDRLTAADILVSYPLLNLPRVEALGGESQKGKLKEKFPKLFEYVARLEEHEGYKRADKKIGDLEAKEKGTSEGLDW